MERFLHFISHKSRRQLLRVRQKQPSSFRTHLIHHGWGERRAAFPHSGGAKLQVRGGRKNVVHTERLRKAKASPAAGRRHDMAFAAAAAAARLSARCDCGAARRAGSSRRRRRAGFCKAKAARRERSSSTATHRHGAELCGEKRGKPSKQPHGDG